MEIREVPAGRELVREGDVAHEFMLLLEGAADVAREGATVAQLAPGEFFGEIALLTRSRRTATVTTTAPSKVLVLEADAFRRLTERDQTFRARVWATAAARL